jgi:hypothetical protein
MMVVRVYVRGFPFWLKVTNKLNSLTLSCEIRQTMSATTPCRAYRAAGTSNGHGLASSHQQPPAKERAGVCSSIMQKRAGVGSQIYGRTDWTVKICFFIAIHRR